MHRKPEIVALVAAGGDRAVAEFLRERLGHLVADSDGIHVAEDAGIVGRASVIDAQASLRAVEDVVVEAVVPSGEVHHAHNIRRMWCVVRCIAVGNGTEGYFSADDVMHESSSLGHVEEGDRGKHDVVVDQAGAVTDLYHQVAGGVVREGVAGYARADGLPVQPHAADAVVKDVVLDQDVDGGVKLYAAHLGAAELDIVIDIVDVVVLDGGEDSSEMSDDAGLAAVADLVAADDMRADVLLVPAHVIGLEDGLELTVEAYELALGRPAVVAGSPVLAEADTDTFGVAYLVVFDDPALAPVGAYQAFLIGGRRSPLRGGLAQMESPDGDVVDTRELGIEDRRADVDLSEFLVGIGSTEIGVYDGLGIVHFHIPAEMLGCVLDTFKGSGLPQGLSVEIDLSEADVGLGVIDPVPCEDLRVWIEVAEVAVGEYDLPDIGFLFPGPGAYLFRSLDPYLFAFGGLVCDTGIFVGSGVAGIDPLAVCSGMDGDDVAGACYGSGFGYGEERSVFGSGIEVRAAFGDVILFGMAKCEAQKEGDDEGRKVFHKGWF